MNRHIRSRILSFSAAAAMLLLSSSASAQQAGLLASGDDYRADRRTSLALDLCTTSLPAGPFQLRSVLFDCADWVIRERCLPELDMVAEMLLSNPATVVEVQGHTDNEGVTRRNQELSIQRAVSVVDYLVSRGVSRSRMELNGYGYSNPKSTNKTEEGRRQNRRVEIVVR